MKKILLSIATFMMLLALTPVTVHASHIVGMDLTYRYAGSPNTYVIALKYYTDCSPNSIPAPTQVTVCYSSASCNLSGSITMYQNLANQTQVPIPPCIPNPGATTCNGGTAYGVHEDIYTDTLVLPAACNDWVFSYSDCCRNALINTLNNAAGQGIYLSTTCDNFNYPTNSSPTFLNPPVTQFCVNNQFYFDQGGTDIDFDSLAYFLVAPLDGGGGCPAGASFPVTYNPGYSDTVPFDNLNGVVMDPLTGIVSFVPTSVQVGVMAVLVKEYRNGIEIGSIRRDIQINITAACAVNPPVPATFPVTLGGANLNGVGVQCGDSSVILTFPQNPVQCKSIEQYGTDFRILAPNGQPNPAISATAINCQGGVTDSILVHFYYPLKYGITYLWTKIGNDNNTLLSECGSAMAEYDTIPIVLEDTSDFNILTTVNLPCAFDSVTLTFAQALDCYSFAPDGSDLQLVDAVGNTFSLTGAYGIGCNVNNPNSTIFHFDFSSVINGVSPFYLVSLSGTDSTTVANQCGRFVHPGDTIAILIASNDLPINIGPDTIICANDPLPLLDAGLSGATYFWTLNGNPLGITTKTCQTTVPGDYSVLVTIGPNCFGGDTLDLNVVAVPQASFLNQSICDYEPFPVLDAQNPGATYQWTFNGNPIATTQTLATTAAGTYAVAISVGNCTGNATMDLTVNPSPTPAVNDTTVCKGSPAVLDLHGDASDLVFWYADTNLISSSTTLSTDTGGLYIGVLQSVNGCRKADSSFVTVEQPLAPPVVNCGPGSNNLKYSYTWLNIPGATGYEISFDGGANWEPVQIDSFYNTNQTIKDFRVRAVNGIGACRDGNISELAPCEVIVPNIITPNGDGNNDVFYIKNLEGHPNSSLKIMNRWGNIVLNDSNYQNDWGGDKLSDGTYFYILKLDDGKEFTGTLTIINGK